MNEQRRFDWGPPVQSGDSLKEWLVYLAIVIILSIGIWLLLDVNAKKKPVKSSKNSEVIVAVDEKVETVIPKEEKKLTKNEIAPQAEEQNVVPAVQATPVPSLPKNEFFVQIGAFSDEPSANEIYSLLKKEGIDATLLNPDEQFEIYRLVVGPFATENEAESKAEQLNEIGFPCFVVEAQ